VVPKGRLAREFLTSHGIADPLAAAEAFVHSIEEALAARNGAS
jgi:hypothetical protein